MYLWQLDSAAHRKALAQHVDEINKLLSDTNERQVKLQLELKKLKDSASKVGAVNI